MLDLITLTLLSPVAVLCFEYALSPALFFLSLRICYPFELFLCHFNTFILLIDLSFYHFPPIPFPPFPLLILFDLLSLYSRDCSFIILNLVMISLVSHQ